MKLSVPTPSADGTSGEEEQMKLWFPSPSLVCSVPLRSALQWLSGCQFATVSLFKL